ncbi:MAG: DUF5666 domain-containing protein [Candidatus Andersenbacteria bacterium]|nr:DUF5666 domain-containing protein [Candidatus Andersenbacteria bacterium]
MHAYVKSLVVALALALVLPTAAFASTTTGTFSGFVQSIGTDSFILQTKNRYQQTINVSSGTVITMKGKTETFSDIMVGDQMTIKGVWDKTNKNVAAETIIINATKRGWVTGTITGINGTTISLLSKGTTYSVDASNVKTIRRFNASMKVSDMQIGDVLQVQGVIPTSTSITATTIKDLSLQARHGQFDGTVQSVSGSSFALQSNHRGVQTINTNSSTIYKHKGAVVSFSSITAGSSVRVYGVWNNTNSNVTAKLVIIK